MRRDEGKNNTTAIGRLAIQPARPTRVESTFSPEGPGQRVEVDRVGEERHRDIFGASQNETWPEARDIC